MSMLSRDELVESAAIFGDAVDLEPAARLVLLDARCGSRTALRAELDSLFAAHDGADAFMQPASGDAARTEPALEEDAAIGPWRLLGKIGAGGMGDVYLAERSDGVFEGRAAIKFTRATGARRSAAVPTLSESRWTVRSTRRSTRASISSG